MPLRKTITSGDRFGRLTILFELEKRKEMRYFRCKCDCGNDGDYRFVSLSAGVIKSCGCLRNEQNRTVAIKHGLSGSSLYNSWHSMKQRCLNPKCAVYKYYGGRGIKICEEWFDFEPFKDWAMANGYQKGLTIERVNVNGGYEPTNCKWITKRDQTRNTRRNVIIEFNGERLCVKDWAIKLGISNSAMQNRLREWPLERALLTRKKDSNAS